MRIQLWWTLLIKIRPSRPWATTSDASRIWRLFWYPPTHDRSLSAKDSKVLEEFRTNFRVEDQRRGVSLPKKQDTALPSIRLNAEKRRNNLTKILENNEALKQMYYDQIINYITRGQVEVVPTEDSRGKVFYLPQQAMKKWKHEKTNLRIHFDASSHVTNATLNEVLEMGPNLLLEIFAILPRFRLRSAVIISDVTQAFLQLALDEKDRDLTRFVCCRITEDSEGQYHTTDEIMTYRFTRLPFDLNFSPFLTVRSTDRTRWQAQGPIPHRGATFRQ